MLKIKAKLDHYTAPIKVTSAIVSVVSFAGGVTTGVLAAITPVASCAFPPLAILAVGLILVAAVALLFVFILSRCIQSKDASPKINNPKLQENDISRETDADNENEEENEREVSENNESHLSQSLDAQKSVSDMLKENYAKFLKKEKILQEKSKEISEIHSNLGDRSPVIDSSLTPPPPSPPLSPPPEDRQSEVSQAKRSFPKTFYRDFFFKRLAKKISASNMIKLEETNHTEAPEKEETLPLKIEEKNPEIHSGFGSQRTSDLDASDAKGDKASDQNLQTTPSEKSQDSKKVESKFPNNWYRSHFFNSFEKLIKNTKQ